MNIETLIKRLEMFKGNASLIMTADEVQQHIDLLEFQQKTIEGLRNQLKAISEREIRRELRNKSMREEYLLSKSAKIKTIERR